MADNAIKTTNDIEIYQHDIYYFADEFIEKELDGNGSKMDRRFRDMILYISDRIPKPPHEDINLLDKIFDIYVRLCAKYERLPTLECFSWLVNIHRATFTSWINREYRASSGHSDTTKKWLEICKGFCVDELSNAKIANPNLIFTAKAAYFMRETSPIPQLETEHGRMISADELIRLDCNDTISADKPLILGD